MISAGNEPLCLITTVNESSEMTWTHGLRQELINKAGLSLQIPIKTIKCSPHTYAEAFEKVLIEAAKNGAEACAFGDMDIQDHLIWNQNRCNAANIHCITPLWNINRQTCINEQLSLGFKPIIKIVEKKYFTADFLGKCIDKQLLEKIKATGADPCGENGEYHTFVVDGPLYHKPIAYQLGQVIDLGNYLAIDLL
jgi:uncharacterized protein (TIGR00290 family)